MLTWLIEKLMYRQTLRGIREDKDSLGEMQRYSEKIDRLTEQIARDLDDLERLSRKKARWVCPRCETGGIPATRKRCPSCGEPRQRGEETA